MNPSSEPDLRSLWQTQPELPLGMSVAEIRAKAGRFRGVITSRNNREWLAAALVAAAFSTFAIVGDDPIERAGNVLVVVGAAYVSWHLHAHGRARPVPRDGLPCVAFYRRELVRQRELLRGVWRWYLGPLCPGLAVLTLGRFLADPGPGPVLGALFCVAVFAGIGWLNHRGAGELQRQIDALPADESAP